MAHSGWIKEKYPCLHEDQCSLYNNRNAIRMIECSIAELLEQIQ